MKKLVIGILAHVDAGKTTLSEGLLYATGKIKKQGRVDHRDTFLDTHELERERGITIFSKQALLSTPNCDITMLDTPGHVDFSAEAERAMQVLDYAVLVISGTDGVQAHTETIWRLLRRYNIPTFIFVTKMDVAGRDKASLTAELQKQLSPLCMDFTSPDPEELAMCSEEVLERYSASGKIDSEDITTLIARRRLFPCYFGSGLKLSGVEEFLSGLDCYTRQPEYSQNFGARVFKIARDAAGTRLTYIKITGGELHVRDELTYTAPDGTDLREKVSQLRLYSGAKFTSPDVLTAGSVCAVTGLTATRPGQGLGGEQASAPPVLEPVLTYRILLPAGCDPMAMLPKLRELEDEDPLLRIIWNSQLREIHVQLMGEIQIEILKRIIQERFGIAAQVDSGRIMYRETIAAPMEGVGHFEPLRHYAEVHLLMEPLPRGSGLIFDSVCADDELDRNWQKLILTHLDEKQHLGVLTGSPITDMKITLTAGRAHVKHTEGGDFRQATYRAVRQGLMKAESLLLEPYYSFRLEIPSEQLGRAINDIRAMSGTLSSQESDGVTAVLEGVAPVSAMGGYAAQVAAYARGRGKLSVQPSGYEVCRNQSKLVDELGYDPEGDLENTPDSVFCIHGAGQTVKWSSVSEYMHLDTGFGREHAPLETPRVRMHNLNIDEKELEAIMDREFGPIRRPMYTAPKVDAVGYIPKATPKKEYLIVDGYNVIFAWEELNAIAQDNLDLARLRLADTLANFRGYTKCELVLVFDAYKVSGGAGERSDYHGIHLAYTKQGETGDAYIQRLVSDIGKNYSVRVISSDSMVQLSAFGSGVLRQSAAEFGHEVDWVMTQISSAIDRMDISMRGDRVGGRVKLNGKQ